MGKEIPKFRTYAQEGRVEIARKQKTTARKEVRMSEIDDEVSLPANMTKNWR